MDMKQSAVQFLHDALYRTKITLSVSFIINLIYALIKLTLGIWGDITWDIVLALYYMVLALMRFILARMARRSDFGSYLRGEYQIYRFVGAVLLFLNMLLSVMVAAYLRREVSYGYSTYRLIAMGVYAFMKIIAATIAVIRSPKQHSPLYSAAKNLSFAAAIVSVLSLEEAMLESYSDNTLFRDAFVGATGFFFALILLALSGYMIIKATIKLRKGASL